MFCLPKLTMSWEMQASVKEQDVPSRTQYLREQEWVGCLPHVRTCGGGKNQKKSERQKQSRMQSSTAALREWGGWYQQMSQGDGNLLGEHGLCSLAQVWLRTSSKDLACCRVLNISFLWKQMQRCLRLIGQHLLRGIEGEKESGGDFH